MMFSQKTQAGVVLLAAVIIGAAAGSSVERMRGEPERAPRVAGRRPPPGTEGRMPAAFENLDLTDAQRESIRSVFQAYEPRTRAIMEDMIPRMRAVQDSAREEIDSILTADQRTRLGEAGNFWERRGGDRRGRRGGRPGYPGASPPDSGRR